MARSKKIMVVDDEAGIRRLLFDVLSSEGFTVSLAKDGQDSLNQMKNHRFDLLITDINMPRLDGIELLKKMKRAGRKERVIIMTGRSSVDHKRLGKEILPVFTKLHKPFHMNKFKEVVSLALAPQRKRKGKGMMELEGRG
jgi:two-component system response regulator (stage 0 sporulation protein F)